MKKFNLHFEGSILDEMRSSLPTYSGVYLVYCGTLSEDHKCLRCRAIIYIGQAMDIRLRHSDHDRRKDFLAQLRPGEVLFYSYAKVDMSLLDRIESALIYHHKPLLNEKGKESYLYPDTEIDSDGQCALLDKQIIVKTTMEFP